MKEQPLNFNHNDDKTIVVLSPDNKAVAEKMYQQLHFSLKELIECYNQGTLDEGFKKTLLSVSEHNLSGLLKAFGYEGILKKEKKERHSKIRSLNEENRELRKQLGDKVSNEDAREKIKNLSETIKKWWRKKGFGHTSDIDFTEYGICKVKFSCMMSGDFMLIGDETPVLSKEKKKDWVQELKDQGYNIKPEDRYNWEVVDNDKNKDLIIKNIKNRFPSVSIHSFENWYGRKSLPTLRDVTLYIHNLDDI